MPLQTVPHRPLQIPQSDSRPPSSLLLAGLLFVLFIAPFDEGAGRDLLPLTALAVTTICLGAVLVRRLLGTPRQDPATHASLPPNDSSSSSSLPSGRRDTIAAPRAPAPMLPRSPALAPVLVFLAVAAASVTWSIDRFVSLTGVMRLTACTVAFLLILNEFSTERHARIVCSGLVVLACLLSPLGIWQALTASGLFPTPAGARAHSVFVTPNTFAAFLIITLPLAVALALTARTRARRLLGWAAALLLLVALVLTQSRGAWAASLIGMSLLAWQLVRLNVLRPKTLILSAAAALVLLAALTATGAHTELRRRLASVLHPLQAATLLERFHYWDSAIQMARESLPLGIGLDTYHIDYPAHQHPSLAGTRQWFAHNDPLQVLVELGPLGLAALLWLFARMAKLTAHVLAAAPRADTGRAHDPSAPLLAACAAGAASGLAHSLIDYNLYVPSTALSIFVCFGILAAAHSRLPRLAPASRATLLIPRPVHASGATPRIPRLVRQVLSVSALGAATAAVVLAVRPLLAQQLLMQSPCNAPVAVALCPISANFWAQLARSQADTDPAAARRACFNAIRLSPRTAVFYALLADLPSPATDAAPGSPEADPRLRWLAKACALDPNSAALRSRLALASTHTGLPRQARP